MNLQEIYERQYMRVYRVALLYLKNAPDAEDAVQSIFLKCMEKDMAFQSEEHENAWFLTVTRNHCKDVLKAFWRRKVDLGEIPEAAGAGQEHSDLFLQIRDLPKKYREVLYLYYYEEYSIREMATLLHRKESTIQTQLAAGRKRLRTKLESEGAEYGA
jgi:RNA polymerase sigma-70 factor (ECF subfamily)